jgi:hypothetical protein
MKEFIKKSKSNDSDYIKSASVVLNPKSNGGESIVVSCDFYNNGDGPDGTYTEIEIDLNCYGAHSTKIYLGEVGISHIIETFSQMKKVEDSIKTLGTFTV